MLFVFNRRPFSQADVDRHAPRPGSFSIASTSYKFDQIDSKSAEGRAHNKNNALRTAVSV